MSRTSINEAITISAWYFKNRQLDTLPRRMDWAGHSYTFHEGLQYSITRAGNVTRIFDMMDGAGAKYRLKCADDSEWTLVAITNYA